MTRTYFGFALVAIWLMTGSGLLADPAPTTSKQPRANNPSIDNKTPNLDAHTIGELNKQHTEIQAALTSAQARISLMTQKLYDSRLVVRYLGKLDRPFELAWIDLFIDGMLVYHRDFQNATEIQSLKLFDAYLTPRRHVLQLSVYARGPDDPPSASPGYYAGCGMNVHLRNKSTTETVFSAEQEGDNPGPEVPAQPQPTGGWDVVLKSSFETRSH